MPGHAEDSRRTSTLQQFHSFVLGMIRASSECQQGVLGPESVWHRLHWRQLLQSFLLGCKIRFNVYVCRFDAFVAKPQSDDSDVYSRLQQMNPGRVSNNVRGNGLATQSRTSGRSFPSSLFYQVIQDRKDA